MQTVHVFLNQIAEKIETISVKPNKKVDTSLEENPQIKIYLWDERGRGPDIEKKIFFLQVKVNRFTSTSRME